MISGEWSMRWIFIWIISDRRRYILDWSQVYYRAIWFILITPCGVLSLTKTHFTSIYFHFSMQQRNWYWHTADKSACSHVQCSKLLGCKAPTETVQFTVRGWASTDFLYFKASSDNSSHHLKGTNEHPAGQSNGRLLPSRNGNQWQLTTREWSDPDGSASCNVFVCFVKNGASRHNAPSVDACKQTAVCFQSDPPHVADRML